MEKYDEEKEEKSIKVGKRCRIILASEAKSCEIRQRTFLRFVDKACVKTPLSRNPWG